MVSGAGETDAISKQSNELISSLLDRLKSFGAVATAIVGLGSTLFACSADNIKRNDAFMSTVAAQETQWRSLYDQYFAALSAKDDAEGLREKRLLSICQFSNRTIPNFKEHRLGYIWFFDDEVRQSEARDQLEKLKSGLRTALATDGIGTEKSAECVLNQKREQEEDARNERERVTQKETTASPQSVSATAQTETVNRVKKSNVIIKKAEKSNIAPAKATLTLAAGDPRGYDIDVFWCVGSDDQDRQAQAAKIASMLSRDAAARARIGDLFRIGRVRLRPLPAEKQLSGFYPSTGFEVRGDEYETSIANALTQRINLIPESGPFVPVQSGLDTRWYLSIFVCS